jgi:DNA-binding XRE family transcriptional regulator
MNLAIVINLKNKNLILSFGIHIRKLRVERAYSMRYLADLADVNYTQISKIETGKINTTISTAYALAKALDVSIDELFKFKIK